MGPRRRLFAFPRRGFTSPPPPGNLTLAHRKPNRANGVVPNGVSRFDNLRDALNFLNTLV